MSEAVRGSAAPFVRSDEVVRALSQTREAWRSLDRGDTAACTQTLRDQQRLAAGDAVAELVALIASALIRGMLGQLRRAADDLAEADRRLQTLMVASLRPHWEQAALVCDWMAGNWTAAESRSARMERVPPAPPNLTLCLRAELLREVGRSEQADAVIERLQAQPRSALTGWASARRRNDPAERLAELRAMTSGRLNGMLPLVLARIARIGFAAGDAESTAAALAGFDQLSRSDPLAETLAELTLAMASGKAGAARRAQDRAEAEGLEPIAAEALTVQGLLGYQPERTLRSARDRWLRIGAAVRAAELSARLGDRPTVVLSPREQELVEHVHDGRTNRDIAAAMHLSIKSVEAYLTRVYIKTGCTSRVELAIAAAERRFPAEDHKAELSPAFRRPG